MFSTFSRNWLLSVRMNPFRMVEPIPSIEDIGWTHIYCGWLKFHWSKNSKIKIKTIFVCVTISHRIDEHINEPHFSHKYWLYLWPESIPIFIPCIYLIYELCIIRREYKIQLKLYSENHTSLEMQGTELYKWKSTDQKLIFFNWIFHCRRSLLWTTICI